MLPNRTMLLILLIFFLLSSALAGCSEKTVSGDSQKMNMTSTDGMPVEVKNAPVTVQQSYKFAVENPETLKEFPCYCGCGKMGHTSNYSCYIQDVDSSGKISYDTHALGCSICVDITQDVMRLLKEKKSVPEIQTYIDDIYSKYGPSNMTSASVPTGIIFSNPSDMGVLQFAYPAAGTRVLDSSV